MEDKNFVPCPGKFLVQGAIPEFAERFPHHNKGPKEQPIGFWWDIGCNLYLWNEERNGRWIGFPTLDTHVYRPGVYRSNFKLKEKFKNIPLVYHLNNGYRNCTERSDAYEMLQKAYKEVS